MCTVTFIPVKEAVYITHNRDEKKLRPRAVPPRLYTINNYQLIFPRDGQAGGSWIALHQNGGAAVLLNGAFTKHHHQPPYRKSRGLAFLDILTGTDLLINYQQVSLENIEPFTVILWTGTQLYECRWDGGQKHIKQLDGAQCYSWSSATLYDADVIEKRNNWFINWLQQHPQPGMDEIIDFHLFGGDGDAHNDLRMNRDGITLTVSITALKIQADAGLIQYLDLQDNSRHQQTLNFKKAALTQ